MVRSPLFWLKQVICRVCMLLAQTTEACCHVTGHEQILFLRQMHRPGMQWYRSTQAFRLLRIQPFGTGTFFCRTLQAEQAAALLVVVCLYPQTCLTSMYSAFIHKRNVTGLWGQLVLVLFMASEKRSRSSDETLKEKNFEQSSSKDIAKLMPLQGSHEEEVRKGPGQ